jgi:hypothetical protein
LRALGLIGKATGDCHASIRDYRVLRCESALQSVRDMGFQPMLSDHVLQVTLCLQSCQFEAQRASHSIFDPERPPEQRAANWKT